MTSGNLREEAGIGAAVVTAPPVALRGVLAWALGATFFMFAFLQRVSPSVMVDELMRDFSVSAIILGNLSACYFYTYAAMQIPIGLMVERLGPRIMLTGFALVCVGGNMIFALADSVTGAYLGRILIGAGAGAGWVGTLTLATRWLPARRFALLTGLGQVFGMAGAVFGQYPLSLAVETFGWRQSLMALAALIGLMSVLFWLVVRDFPPGAAPASRENPQPAAPMLKMIGEVVRRPQSWLAAAVGLAYTGPMLGFAGLWAVPFLVSAHGYSRSEAAGLASLLFIGWAVAAPLIGWFADRTGWFRPILVAGGVISALSLSGVLYLPPLWGPWQMTVLVIVAGAAGATMILTFSCARAANRPEASAAVYGFVNMAVTASGGLLQPLVGWLLDLQWDGRMEAGVPVYETGHYLNALSVFPLIAFLGAIAALFLRGAPRP